MSIISEFLPSALIDTFTRGTRVAVPYLQSLARTTRTQTDIFAELRSAGLQFRDSEARVVIRATRAAAEGASIIRGFIRTRPIDPQLLAKTPTGIRKNFAHIVRVNGTDLFTGEAVTQYVTVSTNSILSLNEVLDAARTAAETMPGETSLTISRTMGNLEFLYEEGMRASNWVPGT